MRQLLFCVIVIVSAVALNSCKVGRFFVYNFADIKDYKIFSDREAQNDSSVFHFAVAEKGKVPKEIALEGNAVEFEAFLESNKTVAFLIIKNDTIQYEKYFQKYDEESIVPSFSMAKSITSILIGCAIDDGFITSVDELVTSYIPELKGNGYDKLTIEHLLQMTSGLDFNESYVNPFGHAATFYYGTNLRKAITKLKLKSEPGVKFEYVSGDTQILGLVLDRALKNKALTEYLEEKLWIPLEMEFDATWSLDRKKDGLEKTFCCINARARDFAKIGRLYLNKGNWNGRQIVSESWVAQSVKLDTSNGSAWYYQYQWWLPTKTGDFMANGILGQYIYVNPESNLIIVRLGKKKGDVHWGEVFTSLGQAYKD